MSEQEPTAPKQDWELQVKLPRILEHALMLHKRKLFDRRMANAWMINYQIPKPDEATKQLLGDILAQCCAVNGPQPDDVMKFLESLLHVVEVFRAFDKGWDEQCR